MEKYSTIHPLYMSFFSRDIYRYVGRNWKGLSFVYLLLLLALCWMPIMIKMNSKVSEYLTNEAPKIVRQVPVISISQGEVSIDEKTPYFITNSENDALLMIIDTTGQFTSLDDTDAKALLTKTKFIIRKGPAETRAFELSQLDGIVIDQDMIFEWIEIMEKWFAILLYPFVLFFSYLYRVLQVLLYAAIGILFARNLGASLHYQELLSIAIVADTPSIILNTLYNYLDIRIPFWWLICFIIAMSYLVFGIKANSESDVGVHNY